MNHVDVIFTIIMFFALFIGISWQVTFTGYRIMERLDLQRQILERLTSVLENTAREIREEDGDN